MIGGSSLIADLRKAKSVVVFTGAGASAESGIATFRDRQTGLWANFDARVLATPAAFERDPSLVWGWYEWRRTIVRRARPNEAHLAIAVMAKAVSRFSLVTQNVDDLHERAGSVSVIHLHGELERPYCETCGSPYEFPKENPVEVFEGRRIEPPRCLACAGRIRPGVVWFGEALPARAWDAAVSAATHCDAFLTVGTSSIVQPAASLTEIAKLAGAVTIQVNPSPTELDGHVTHTLCGRAGTVLPLLVADVWGC